MVHLLIEAGANLEARDREEHDTPLSLAASIGRHPEIVQVLVDAGADLEARDDFGRTPLMSSAWNSWHGDGGVPHLSENMQVLIEAGADLNARDGVDGRTPLMIVAWAGQDPGMLRLLMDAGADVTVVGDDGRTAWDLIQEDDHLRGSEAYRNLERAYSSSLRESD